MQFRVDQEVLVDGTLFEVEAGPFPGFFADLYILRDDQGWCCTAEGDEIASLPE